MININCPHCGNSNNQVYRVMKKYKKNFRYRKCDKCKKTFKTVESLAYSKDYKKLYYTLLSSIRTIILENEKNEEPEW